MRCTSNAVRGAIAACLLLPSCATAENADDSATSGSVIVSAPAPDDGTGAAVATATTGVVAVDAVFAEPTFEVQVTEDVVYGQGLTHDDWSGTNPQMRNLTLDVYQPLRDDATAMPVVVMIHGGGFRSGSSKHGALSAMAERFAARGWVAFSINYRLIDDFGSLPADYPRPPGRNNLDQFNALYPACRDAKAAIRWIKANADRYGVAPTAVTAIGGSAGSFIAVALGVSGEGDCLAEIDEAVDPTLAATNLDQTAEVHTVINHWGGTAIVDMLELLDGSSRFGPDDAPLSTVHGTDDRTVDYTNAERLRDAYAETGVAFVLHRLDGAGHGAWQSTVDGDDLWRLAFDVITEQQALVVE
ncbi:MAG: alpha/beta hydrolase [Actinomycetota bacterium]